jgi:hypothetical protein
MADYQYVTSNGTIVPDTGDLLTTVQNEYRAVFGADLIVDPSTPQGVLIAAETLARDAVVRNNAALANQINPNLAGGVFLDAIMSLTGSARVTATRSTVTATLSGEPGAIVPQGSIAATGAGDQFSLTGAVVIGSLGTVDGLFQSVRYGAIPAVAGALNTIVSGVLGWESVTNTDAAIVGKEEQSDASARALRRNTLATQGVALPEAITSALYLVDGVKSLAFRENTAATTQTIDTVSMIAHSVYACVDGGTDTDVATSLLANKSMGAGWNGTTTVAVVEPSSGQSYSVKFSRPSLIPMLVRATVRADQSLIDPQTSVKQAIMAYINGEVDGETGWGVGTDVSSFELSGAVNVSAPGVFVQNMEITKSSVNVFQNATIAIEITEKATLTESSIQVVVV